MLPSRGSSELNMFVALSYIVANIMANAERGCSGDESLEGIHEAQKQYIQGLMFPTSTKKQEQVEALG